ncbi:MAG TPA: potassium channel family protein [Quisquiliibacterium sp.]|nr:potassium channel family protein [Quisquiliibacterium sp.]
MHIVAPSCVALFALTCLIHYEVLRGLSLWLPRLAIPDRSRLLVVIFAAFVAHALEIGLYGVSIHVLIHHFDAGTLKAGGPVTLADSIYFSAETYTSLGFGDVVPIGAIRLLAGTEALNGLLMIGWTASYAYITMERFWRDPMDTGDT